MSKVSSAQFFDALCFSNSLKEQPVFRLRRTWNPFLDLEFFWGQFLQFTKCAARNIAIRRNKRFRGERGKEMGQEKCSQLSENIIFDFEGEFYFATIFWPPWWNETYTKPVTFPTTSPQFTTEFPALSMEGEHGRRAPVPKCAHHANSHGWRRWEKRAKKEMRISKSGRWQHYSGSWLTMVTVLWHCLRCCQNYTNWHLR